VSQREPRVTVAVAMAPAALMNPHLEVPSLTMIGGIDSVVDNTQTRAAYAASVTPKLLVRSSTPDTSPSPTGASPRRTAIHRRR